MTIRSGSRVPRTSIPCESLRDPELSLSARGLLAYLLTFPDNTDFDFPLLCLKFPKERSRSVRAALQELREVGYLSGGPLAGEEVSPK